MVTGLTPAYQAEFEQVSPDVDVEHLDEEQIEVKALQRHPAEGDQQGVVERERHPEAEATRGRRCRSLTAEEEDVEEDEGHAEVEVDLDRGVLPGLPVTHSKVSQNKFLAFILFNVLHL